MQPAPIAPLATPNELQTNPVWLKIQALDLEPIKFKLVAEHGWKLEQADKVETQYKQYLYLSATTIVEDGLPPSKIIDEFWHQHILDTRKYAEDCENVFGRFVHHYPYFGLMGGEDYERFSNAGENAERLFIEVFGESPYESNMIERCNSGCDGGGGCSGCVGCSTGPADDDSDAEPVTLKKRKNAGYCCGTCCMTTMSETNTVKSKMARLKGACAERCCAHCSETTKKGLGSQKRPTREDSIAFLERGYLIGWE